MTAVVRLMLLMFWSTCVALVTLDLIRTGLYAWTLFLFVPFWTGALVSWAFRPASASAAAGMGLIAGAAGCLLPLLFGFEGMICVAMALPLAVPLCILGSWLCYKVTPEDARPDLAAALLLPVSLCFDLTAKPPVYEVRTSIVVNAPPRQVWKHVVTFSDIPEPADWFFRAGLAYPKRARIEGSGTGSSAVLRIFDGVLC